MKVFIFDLDLKKDDIKFCIKLTNIANYFYLNMYNPNPTEARPNEPEPCGLQSYLN